MCSHAGLSCTKQNILNIIQIFWDLKPCRLVNIHPWVILGSCCLAGKVCVLVSSRAQHSRRRKTHFRNIHVSFSGWSIPRVHAKRTGRRIQDINQTEYEAKAVAGSHCIPICSPRNTYRFSTKITISFLVNKRRLRRPLFLLITGWEICSVFLSAVDCPGKDQHLPAQITPSINWPML
jgi:hypothetical protein